MRASLAPVAAIVLAAACAALDLERPAQAAGPGYCAGVAGREIAHPVPPELVDIVARAFAIGVEEARIAAYVRCVGPQLLACWVGANLNCGLADTRRRLPGAEAFCRANPDATSIPMSATGHDTIYDWRCIRGRAVAGRAVTAVDPQGYVADNWKQLS